MKLAVIVGTTRQNRLSPRMAQWIVKTAQNLPDTTVELVDLMDYPLPFFDEAISPRFNQNRHVSAPIEDWLKLIGSFDAYIFVTPEYNHAIPAVLKNALDYLTWELLHKPAAIASHGTVGGARAALNLKIILSESRAVVIPENVTIAGLGDVIDEAGVLSEASLANPYGPQARLDKLLSELQWYSDALAAARKE